MSNRPTVAVRKEWANRAAKEAGGTTAWAEALGVDKSTASRYLTGVSRQVSPQFIAAVLTRYPVTFDAAFDVIFPDFENIAGEERLSA